MNYYPLRTTLNDHYKPLLCKLEGSEITKKSCLEDVLTMTTLATYTHDSENQTPEKKEERNTTFKIILKEYMFLASDRLTIFPESTELLDTMLRSKLNVADFESLIPPDSVFAVAIPKGYTTPSGTPLSSFIVSWCDMEQDVKLATMVQEAALGGHQNIHSACEGKTLQILSLRATHSRQKVIESILSTNQAQQVHDVLNDVDITEDSLASEIDMNDAYMAKAMVKIAVAIAVFNSAYDNFLSSGFPKGVKAERLISNGTVKSIRMSGKGIRTESNPKAGHIRSFHFRQLRDSKFYKGEHANKPVGSRWVPVKEAWIGEDINAHTAKNVI
jgi:hypothetical protein